MIKRALMRTAVPLSTVPALERGSGSVQARRAETTALDKKWAQGAAFDGTGTGSLELSRGQYPPRERRRRADR